MPAPSPKQSLANTKAAPATTATTTPPASTLWDFLGPWGNPSSLQPAGSAFPTPPAAPVQTQAGYPTPGVQSLRNALAMAVMGGGGGGGGGPGGGLPGETPEDRAALQWNLRNRGIHSYARPPMAAPSPTTTGSTKPTAPAKPSGKPSTALTGPTPVANATTPTNLGGFMDPRYNATSPSSLGGFASPVSLATTPTSITPPYKGGLSVADDSSSSWVPSWLRQYL